MIELKEFVKLPTFRGGSLSASATRPLRSQSSGSEPSAAPALLGATREEIMEALQQKEAAVEHLYSEGEVQAALSELLVQGRATKEEVGREWTAAVAQAFGGVIRRMQREMLKKRHIPAVREESRPENDDIFIRVYKDPREQLQARLNESACQFDVNFRDFCRLLTGWLCIILLCHGPWFAAASIFVAERECDGFVPYLRGFLIFNGVSLGFNTLLSLSHSVDHRQTCLSRAAPWLAFLFSIAFMAYNLLGVILVWNATPDTDDCTSMRALSIAIIVMFLLLPCVCAVLQAWVIPKTA